MNGQSDDNFFLKWNVTREKGIFPYIVRSTVPSIVIIIFYVVISLTRYKAKGQSLESMVLLSIFILVAYILSSALRWAASEKRYMNIEKIRSETKRKK